MIIRLHDLNDAWIDPLLTRSQEEGFRFLVRLRDDWKTGRNRFDGLGEAFFAVQINDRIIAVGGINRQDHTTGRLRRFYVLPDYRGQGVGKALLEHIVHHARKHFLSIVLHTETVAADSFYRSCGFSKLPDSLDPTHRLQLKTEQGGVPSAHPRHASCLVVDAPGTSCTTGKRG
jgi:GNAT superfamily N-acetyltransferase